MSTPFADPASPSAIEYPDLHGALLLVEVLGFEEHVPTVHTKPGEKNPAVRGNLTVLDGRHAGRVYEDALIFPKVLIGQLRSRVGRMVLGRLVQGEAKTGQTAPWKLDPATDQDRALAQRAVNTGAGGGQPPQQQQQQQSPWQAPQQQQQQGQQQLAFGNDQEPPF